MTTDEREGLIDGMLAEMISVFASAMAVYCDKKVREAVDAERERCAKIAERDADTGDWPPARATAAEIREGRP